tara:strand:- start:7913 stop:8485 length:573 start_codon:yes stop_codon:yes gene_type:complete
MSFGITSDQLFKQQTPVSISLARDLAISYLVLAEKYGKLDWAHPSQTNAFKRELTDFILEKLTLMDSELHETFDPRLDHPLNQTFVRDTYPVQRERVQDEHYHMQTTLADLSFKPLIRMSKEDKRFLTWAINQYVPDDPSHPYCDDKSLPFFMKSYVLDVLWWALGSNRLSSDASISLARIEALLIEGEE